MTCWRRLRHWTQAGVWPKIHQILLGHLRQADKIDWSRAVNDSASVRAVFGGTKQGSGLGMYRLVVGPTLSWLHQYRRLPIPYERRADIHQAFLDIGCPQIYWECLE